MAFKRVVLVLFAMVIFAGPALAEDFKVGGFTRVVCNDEGNGNAPCSTSSLRLNAKSDSFAVEVETVSASRDNINWLRELIVSHRREGFELTAGRIFVAAAYVSPSPRVETASGPRVPVTCYGWGLRLRQTDEVGRQVTVDITGKTDEARGFRTGGFDDPEISLRFTRPVLNVAGNISGNIQASKDFLRLSVDYGYIFRGISVRGALYRMDERLSSDKLGGYAFFGKEIIPHFELHAQADYQDDEFAGDSAILTLGLRLFNSSGWSLTADREIFTEREDRTMARIMWVF